MKNALADFITDLQAARTAKDAAQDLVTFLQASGALTVHTFFGPRAGDHFVSTYPDWWVPWGYETGLITKYHVLEHARTRLDPLMFGIDFCPANKNATPEGIKIVNEAYSSFGQRSSVVFPIGDHPMGRPRGGVSIGFAEVRPSFERLMADYGDVFNLAAYAAQSRMIELRSHHPAPTNRLTTREQEVLSHVADGRRSAEISERLGIAQVTVNLHLQNARRKLNASTLPQAVANALTWGWIAP